MDVQPPRTRRWELLAVEGPLIGLFAVLWQAQVWLTDTPELHGSKLVTVPCGLLMTVPLLWRRSAPRTSALLVYGAGVLQAVALGASLPIGFIVSTLVMAAALGSYLETRQSLLWLAVALGATWTIAALDPTSEGIISVIFTAPLFVGAPWLVGRLLRRMRAQHRSLESLTIRLEHEREENARAAVLEERSRIARELHDIIAHSLSVMVVQAGAAEELLTADPQRAREPLVAVRQTGQEALVEMRRLLGLLRTDETATMFAPQPGVANLEVLAEQARATGMRVEVDVRGNRRPLPAGLDVAVYRLVQESLTNTRKHARASCAHVSLRFVRDTLEVEVADDGAAIASSDGAGHGLIGMRERVALYNGSLTTGPKPGGGWLVHASLPLDG